MVLVVFPFLSLFLFFFLSSFFLISLCPVFLLLFSFFLPFSQFLSFPQFSLPFPKSAAPVLPHFLLPWHSCHVYVCIVIILSTGASSGIGAATAVLFAKLGAHLSLTGRNETNLNKVAEECKQHGAKVSGLCDPWVEAVLDFTHAHLHKCMHFFLCASKFSNLHAHCACNFSVTNFKMNRNSKKLLISTNFQGIKSLCFLYFAICVVFSVLRPSFVHVSTMLCK